MSKAKDFSNDLKQVSNSVNCDVDAILRVVRQRSEQAGDSESTPVQIDSKIISLSGVESASVSPSENQQRFPRVRTETASVQEETKSLENVTTRLRRETNQLLTEASLRQRLKKELPATRQDIIETALQDWLRKYGYSTTGSEHD